MLNMLFQYLQHPAFCMGKFDPGTLKRNETFSVPLTYLYRLSPEWVSKELCKHLENYVVFLCPQFKGSINLFAKRKYPYST